MDPKDSVATLAWPFPQPADVPLNQSFITAQAGGSIAFSLGVPAADGKVIYVKGAFIVPQGALANDTNITLSLDAHDMALHFQPEGLLFASETSLNWVIAGLGPIVNDPPIHFCYVDENGRVVEIPSRSLTVDYNLGVIQLEGGPISHFSRYAFIRW
jgi:hypothetical protein